MNLEKKSVGWLYDPKDICWMTLWPSKILWDGMVDVYDVKKFRCDDSKWICLSLTDPKFKCNMKSLFIIHN